MAAASGENEVMKRSMTCVASSLALAALAASAETDELEQNRARWDAAGMQNYVYGYQKYCDCHRDAPPETVVTVSGGRVARVHHEHAGSERQVPARDGSLDLYWTVDELFTLAADAYAAEAEVRVRYDPELGMPLELYVDYDPDLVGDELDLRITRFAENAG